MSRNYGVNVNNTKKSQQSVETFESKNNAELCKQLGKKISDLEKCRVAIITKGIPVPKDVDTEEYDKKILQISSSGGNGADLDAFISGTLRSVESGLVIIPDFAFAGKKGIEEVLLPNAEYIGMYAFSVPSFNSISGSGSSSSTSEGEEPEEFTEEELASIQEEEEIKASINELTSFDNKKLVRVYMPKAVTVKERAFQGCSNLELDSLPDTVTIIENSAFKDCPKVSLSKLPDSLMYLGNEAFQCNIPKESEDGASVGNYCEVEGVTTLPPNIYYVGDGALPIDTLNLNSVPSTMLVLHSGTSLNAFNEYLSQFIDENTGMLDFSRVPAVWLHLDFIENRKFKDFSPLIGGNLHLVSEVGVIYNYCFCDAIKHNDTNLILDGIHTIGEFAFSCCYKIQSIDVLNEVLRNIGSYAFRDCAELSGVIDLSSVETLGDSAFDGCSQLSGVILSNNLKEIPPYCFNNCGIEEVNIPQNIETIRYNAFSNGSALSILSFAEESKLQGIDSDAFHGCNIQSISFPKTLREISDFAFCDNKNLQNISFDSQSILNRISSNAFRDCGLSGSVVIIMSGGATINSDAFRNNSNITHLTIKVKEETVDENNNTLRSLWLADYSFAECKDIQVIDLSDCGTVNLSYTSFQRCDSLQKLVLPFGVNSFSFNLTINNAGRFSELDLTDFTMEKIEGQDGSLFVFGNLQTYIDLCESHQQKKFRIVFSSMEVALYFADTNDTWRGFKSYFVVKDGNNEIDLGEYFEGYEAGENYYGCITKTVDNDGNTVSISVNGETANIDDFFTLDEYTNIISINEEAIDYGTDSEAYINGFNERLKYIWNYNNTWFHAYYLGNKAAQERGQYDTSLKEHFSGFEEYYEDSYFQGYRWGIHNIGFTKGQEDYEAGVEYDDTCEEDYSEYLIDMFKNGYAQGWHSCIRNNIYLEAKNVGFNDGKEGNYKASYDNTYNDVYEYGDNDYNAYNNGYEEGYHQGEAYQAGYGDGYSDYYDSNEYNSDNENAANYGDYSWCYYEGYAKGWEDASNENVQE